MSLEKIVYEIKKGNHFLKTVKAFLIKCKSFSV
jgi:hypothetical protein